MYNLPFTFEELQEAVDQKRVTKRDHDTLPYSIYNYTDEVQYLNTWDKITENCRGLIIRDNGHVIARPWKKFFNLGQVNLPVQTTDPVEVMDKVDGSLGILYHIPEPYGPMQKNDGFTGIVEHAIATRGSFNSSQAWHATKIWRERYAEFYDTVVECETLRDYTILFEIIYPKNRIVLNYDGMDDLILLGAVETKTGYYLGPKTIANMIAWPGPVVETYEFNTISDALSNMGRQNREGFVIRSHNFLVKIKEPDYLDLHKLVTNLTAKTVWEKLRNGKTPSEIISAFPDEFHDDVKVLLKPLLEDFEKRWIDIHSNWRLVELAAFERFGIKPDRSEWASVIKKYDDKIYLFALLDGRDITEMLWKELRPRESDEVRD